MLARLACAHNRLGDSLCRAVRVLLVLSGQDVEEGQLSKHTATIDPLDPDKMSGPIILYDLYSVLEFTQSPSENKTIKIFCKSSFLSDTTIDVSRICKTPSFEASDRLFPNHEADKVNCGARLPFPHSPYRNPPPPFSNCEMIDRNM